MNEQEQKAELPRPPEWLDQVCILLKQQEPELWQWYSGSKQQESAQEAVRLDLLKSTVEMNRDSCPELYHVADSAARALQLDIPVTIYQAQQSSGWNASVSIDTGQARIVLQGNLTERLAEPELQAVLGHELGHLLLWRMDDEKLLTALRLLGGVCDDPGVHPVYLETYRLLGLYTEIFCDRCALMAQNDFTSAISALIKLETGLNKVNVADYLKQAEEIRRADKDFHDKSRGLTHPELYIRTSALHLWKSDPLTSDAEIDKMIRGENTLDGLDLVGQQQIVEVTRQLIDHFLAPEWMQCDATLAHARLFFADYKFPDPSPYSTISIDESLRTKHNRCLGKSYSTYLLLDFATIDQDLREPALAYAISLSGQLGFKDHFCDVAKRELRMRKKQIDELDKQGAAIIQKLAGEGSGKSSSSTEEKRESASKGKRK